MIVLTLGTFDVLHEGHLELFEDCRALGGLGGDFVVGVNTDRFVETFKPPTHEPQQTRLEAVMEHADVATLHDGDTAMFIAELGPRYLVVGSDWMTKDYMGKLGVTAEWVAYHDIRLVYSPRKTGMSSTMKRAAMYLHPG